MQDGVSRHYGEPTPTGLRSDWLKAFESCYGYRNFCLRSQVSPSAHVSLLKTVYNVIILLSQCSYFLNYYFILSIQPLYTSIHAI